MFLDKNSCTEGKLSSISFPDTMETSASYLEALIQLNDSSRLTTDPEPLQRDPFK